MTMGVDKETEIAAQLWCRPEFGKKEMDVAFAFAIANELRKARSDALEEAAKVAENTVSKLPGNRTELSICEREVLELNRKLFAEEIRALKKGENEE